MVFVRFLWLSHPIWIIIIFLKAMIDRIFRSFRPCFLFICRLFAADSLRYFVESRPALVIGRMRPRSTHVWWPGIVEGDARKTPLVGVLGSFSKSSRHLPQTYMFAISSSFWSVCREYLAQFRAFPFLLWSFGRSYISIFSFCLSFRFLPTFLTRFLGFVHSWYFPRSWTIRSEIYYLRLTIIRIYICVRELM